MSKVYNSINSGLTLVFFLLSFFVFSMHTALAQSCLHTIQRTDTWGDGWNGGTVAVSVNGVTVLSNLSCSGYGPTSSTFSAAAGATIRVFRTAAGSFPSEMRIRVLNGAGVTIINTVQPIAGTATSGGHTVAGSCPVAVPTAPCTNSSAFGSLNAPTLPGSNLISSCTYQSEYNTIFGVVGGNQYQSSYSLGGYITVRHSSYNGTVVAHGNTPLTWTAPISGTYYIHYNTNNNCGTASSCGSSYIACLSCNAPSAPSNDLVCSATNISCGQTIAGTTVNATNSGTGENGSCGVAQSQSGVWYVVPGNGQTMTASLCATAWDSKISVFSGPNCSSLSCVGGNDDWGPSCATSSASYTWNSAAGTNYYILVHGYSSQSAFNLGLTCAAAAPPAPSSVSATSATICNGQSTTLTANGANGTVYWYTGGCGVTQIGTGNSINVAPGSTTTYFARNFNNGLFSATCASTTITVNPTPTVSTSATQNTICQGGNTQLNATVTGVSTPGNLVVNISSGGFLDETSWTLTNSIGQIIGSGGPYGAGGSFVIPIGSSANGPYTFYIETQGSYNDNTVNYSVQCNGNTVISGYLSGGQSTSQNVAACQSQPNLTYSWSPSTGLSNPNIINPLANPSTTTTYTLTATANGCSGSAQRTITVNAVPAVSANASANTLCSGASVTLSGSGASSYAWNNGVSNGVAFTPNATQTYTVTGTAANGCTGTAQTTITVNAAPILSINASANTLCLGTSATLTASGANSYAWNNGISNGVAFTPNATQTYTVTGTAANGCTGTAQVTVTVNPSISWANLQWPATATVNCGSGTNVYGQVYEAALTPAAGANNTIGVQIGVSSSNTNPSTWLAAAWTNASYNAQSGNNDEYVANIGSSLASGTYYYAFRYTTGANGCYVYGGYNASGGGYWNGSTHVNGVLTVGGIDWANLQFPGTGSVCQGQSYNVYGQVYEAGVTNSAGATAGLIAEIGVSSANTNPSTWAANAWTPASFNAQSGNNDEFTAAISGLNTGTYYYTFRYKLSNACAYQYGGFNASGGGFWNGTTNLNGTLTVTPPPAANAGLDIIDPSTCGKNTINLAAAALTAGQSGAWTLVSGTNANGIFSLPTAPNTQFTGSYGGTYVLQWALTSGGCTGTDQMTVTFNQPTDATISALVGSGDLLWCGLTNTDWSTSTNWYQKQAAGHYVRMSGAVQPGIGNEVFTVSTANGGMCVGNSTPSLSVNSNAEDVYVGVGVVLNLSNDSINIAQNLINQGTIAASTGTVNFTGNNNSTVSGSGTTQLFSMRVNKSAGATLTLQQPVLVTNVLTMNQGNVFTTSANVLILGTSSAAPGSLIYNSGTIVGPFKRYFANAASAGTAGLFPVGTAVYNRYADFSFGSGPGVDQFLTVEYITGAPLQGGVPLYNGLPLIASGSLIQNYSADGYWSVIPTNNNYAAPITSVNYGVTLFANNLTGMQSPQVCRIIKSAGSNNAGQHHVAWQACGTHTAINGAANPQSFLITSTATQGFSWFNIGTPNSQALPVELLSFNGDCNEGQVNLSWQTATEHNSDYFEVEKSRDGMNWQVLTTVNAAGNSTQLLNYEATDANAMEGNNYYRLTQVDIDGTTKTYDVINVSCLGAAKGYFSAYPNPSTGSFQVVLNDKQLIGSGNLSVKDTKGSELLNRTIEVKPGINMFSVTDLNLAPGVYYIQIVNGERATEVLKEVIR